MHSTASISITISVSPAPVTRPKRGCQPKDSAAPWQSRATRPPFSRETWNSGSLLVAHPNMLDPNFRRTVLFISSHDSMDGALGVIINRPLGKQVADLVNDVPPDGLAVVPVVLGGPVGRNQLMFAAFEWEAGAGLANFGFASKRAQTA